jgi:hypothetical protein
LQQKSSRSPGVPFFTANRSMTWNAWLVVWNI